MLTVLLTDGQVVEVPTNSIFRQKRVRGDQHVFADGRAALSKGRYYSIGIHTLTAKREVDKETETRWNYGGHFSTGYMFKHWFGLGGGIGLDIHDIAILPVFGEVSGFFTQKDPTLEPNARSGRRILVCYNLQIGYNVPIKDTSFNGDFTDNISGGALIYPAMGLLFPSRFGHSFRLDMGYKFQQYAYNGFSWRNSWVRDTIYLRSFALRAGWVF